MDTAHGRLLVSGEETPATQVCRQGPAARLLGEGHRTVAVAGRLGITYGTARDRAEQVLRKTGIRSPAAIGAVLMSK